MQKLFHSGYTSFHKREPEMKGHANSNWHLIWKLNASAFEFLKFVCLPDEVMAAKLLEF